MIEEKPSSEHADADDNYSDQKRAHLVDSQPLVPSPDAQKSLGTNPASKEDTSKMEEPLKKIEKHTLIIAWAGLIVASITGVVFYCQLQEMGRQTKILSNQAKQAAADSVVSEDHTREQLGIAQQQAKSAQDSVNAIKRQMRQDQRAWIKIEVTEVPKVIEKENPFGNIAITNVGKTAARNLVTEIIVQTLTRSGGPALTFEDGRPRTLVTMGTLFPQQSFPIVASLQKMTPSNPRHIEYPVPSLKDVQAWDAGTFYMAVYGRTQYFDIFGVYHVTLFCSSFTGSKVYISTKSKACSDFNSVDNN